MKSVVQLISDLQDKGYTANLSVDHGDVKAGANQRLPLSCLKIDETYRIEDDSDPTHQNIINWDIYTFLCIMGQFAIFDSLNSWLFYFFH